MRTKQNNFLLALLLTLGVALIGCGGGSSGRSNGGNNSGGDNNSLPTMSPNLAPLPSAVTKVYFVAPNGGDSNSGAESSPFKTISKAVAVAQAGEGIYLREGVYYVSSTITLSGKGSAESSYYIWAYPGEQPVINFAGQSTGSHGFYITGDYWSLRGLEVKNAGKSGIRITGNHNTIEGCSLHHNRDSGLYIGINKGKELNTDGLQAAYNQIINCDSYLNYDASGSTGPGGNADGFACKLNPGKGNVFRGCRAWENSDDGWDLYMANFQVIIENCWTWHNGDPNSYGYSDSNWGGNGNGFKVGGGDKNKPNEFYSYGPHLLNNCIAFDMKYGKGASHKAFDRNNNKTGITMTDCLAFNSITGFSFSEAPSDGTIHKLTNCAAFGCNTARSLKGAQETNTDWTTVSAADFESLAVGLAKEMRQADGSLPDNSFGKLKPDSPLVGKGFQFRL